MAALDFTLIRPRRFNSDTRVAVRRRVPASARPADAAVALPSARILPEDA